MAPASESDGPKVKGTLLLGAVQALRQAKSILNVPTQLLAYMSTRVDILQWYPEQDLQDILSLLADRSPLKREEALVEFGRRSADVHASDLYKHAFQPGSPFAADVLWRAQHDTGVMSYVENEDAMVFELRGFKAGTPMFCICIGGYVEMACKKAGISVEPAVFVEQQIDGEDVCVWTLPKVAAPTPSE